MLAGVVECCLLVLLCLSLVVVVGNWLLSDGWCWLVLAVVVGVVAGCCWLWLLLLLVAVAVNRLMYVGCCR